MTHSSLPLFLDIRRALPAAKGAETRVGWQPTMNFGPSIYDDLVISMKRRIFVIPAKAGIQLFQTLKNSLDSGLRRAQPSRFRRSHDFLRFHHLCLSLILLALVTPLLFPRSALAVRPFITDDARIAGPREFQIESSLRVDKERFQNLNVFSLGVLDKLEVSLNFIDGFMLEDETKYNLSIAGPGLQLKYLFTDGKTSAFPATALVAGFVPPWGTGSETFSPPSWSDYAYLAVTKYFFKDWESLNLHFNLGFTNSYEDKVKTNTTWGIGLQSHLVNKLYLCTEIFSGDPYAITPGALFQVGLRYFISDKMQIDLSTGRGLYGDPMLDYYMGFGLRVVFDTFVKK